MQSYDWYTVKHIPFPKIYSSADKKKMIISKPVLLSQQFINITLFKVV